MTPAPDRQRERQRRSARPPTWPVPEPQHRTPAPLEESPSAAGNQARLHELGIRLKPTVSQPGDAQEHEADRMADAFARGDVVRRKCDSCADEDGTAVHRSAAGPAPRTASPAGALARLSPGGGAPIARSARRDFERFFRADLSHVKVHAYPEAGRASRELRARAFAVGSNIAFAPGEYAPETESGRKLLVHELTHVVRHGPSQSGEAIRRKDEPETGPEAEPAPKDQWNAQFDRPAVGPGNPGPRFYNFRGVLMSEDLIAMRDELRLYVRHHGLRGLDHWHDALNGNNFLEITLPFSAHARAFGGLRLHDARDMQKEMVEEEWRRRLVRAKPTAEVAYFMVRAEAIALLDEFKKNMGTVLELVLKESEKRIEAERIRYGLKKTEGFFSTEYETKRTGDFEALVGAAKDLLVIRERIAALEQKQRVLMPQSAGVGGGYGNPQATAQLGDLTEQIKAERQEYQHAKTAAALRHPSLGAVLDETSFSQSEGDRLERLAEGTTSGKAGMAFNPVFGPQEVQTSTSAILGSVMDKRQGSIDKVREMIADDPDDLWTISPVIQLTLNLMKGEPTGMIESLVKEKLEIRAINRELWGLFVLAIGFALALPTGGTSLAVAASVGTAALSAYQAMQSIHNYNLQMALANTDLDKKAYALAAEEPSLFWVAVDVAFVFLDGSQAIKAFRGIKTEAKAVAEAAEGVQRTRAEEKLLEAAEKVGGSGGARLGERLRDTLAKLRGRPAAQRALGAGKAEVEAIAHASELAAKEARSVETVATVAGHEVKATRSGQIIICTDCTWLRSRYLTELAESPGLLKRLESAEELAIAGKLDAAAKSELKMLTIELEQARNIRITPGALSALPKELEDVAALAPKEATGSKAAIKTGESVPYLESTAKKRGVKGDKLTGDHIPSRAALVDAKQEALWRAEAERLGHELSAAEKDALLLTEAEERQIRDQGLALVKGEKFHGDVSRTFAGRNTAAQIALDASDLSKAVHSDFVEDLVAIEARGELTRAKVAEYVQHYQNLVSKGVIAYSANTNNLLLDFLKRAKP